MKAHRRKLFSVPLAAVMLLSPFGHDAWSQARPIKIIVPLAPGGGADILARLLADRLGRPPSPAFMIENRAGAGSAIGTEAVSRAPPDGNTLLLNTPNLVISALVHKLNYDPLKSFEPICRLVSTPTVIAVNAASPYRTLADLITAARARPGELTLASVGPATTLHVASEKLKRATNANLTYIPFPGTGPTVNTLMGQHVTAVFAEYPAVAEQIKAGILRALATGAAERIEPLPELPTVAESGYPGFAVDLWYGLFAPAKTPKETVSRLAAAAAAAVQDAEMKAKLVTVGFYPAAICEAEFAAYLARQYEEYGRIIGSANITAQ
jgi:tripartite-type tricarboxylate transporter receptor subunit TctC